MARPTITTTKPIGIVRIVSQGNAPIELVPSLKASSTKREATRVINMGEKANRMPERTTYFPRIFFLRGGGGGGGKEGKLSEDIRAPYGSFT